jgi:hypothetical protein
MKIWNIYLRQQTVFVPTVAKTDAGYFLEIAPVVVIKSTDCQEIIEAVKNVISKGNPMIPTPSRENFPKAVILEYAKAKSWSVFVKLAFCWEIAESESTFQVDFQRKSSSGDFESNPVHIKTFRGVAAIDELATLVAKEIQFTAYGGQKPPPVDTD